MWRGWGAACSLFLSLCLLESDIPSMVIVLKLVLEKSQPPPGPRHERAAGSVRAEQELVKAHGFCFPDPVPEAKSPSETSCTPEGRS